LFALPLRLVYQNHFIASVLPSPYLAILNSNLACIINDMPSFGIHFIILINNKIRYQYSRLNCQAIIVKVKPTQMQLYDAHNSNVLSPSLAKQAMKRIPNTP